MSQLTSSTLNVYSYSTYPSNNYFSRNTSFYSFNELSKFNQYPDKPKARKTRNKDIQLRR